MLTFVREFIMARWLRQFKSREKLERYQRHRMQAFKKRVLSRLPFYRDFAGLPFDCTPVVDKALTLQHFADMNILGLGYAKGLALAQQGACYQGVTVGCSSGTSGNRGLFMVTDDEREKWAGAILAKALPRKGVFRRHRIALMLAAHSHLYDAANRSHRTTFRFFDLKQGLEAHLKALQDYQPTIIVGPAHVLGILADWTRNGELTIKPEKAIAGSEVLTPDLADRIAVAWGSPVHQIYQCTEGFLGITCEMGNLHLNEEYILFEQEWIDKERRAFNPIITDFSRRTQAVVRYRMNDVLIASPFPCPCGSPLMPIERIEGRMDDLLIFPSQKTGWAILFPDAARAAILDAAPSATEFHLLQTGPDRLELGIEGHVPQSEIDAATAALGDGVEQAGGRRPSIHLTIYTPVIDHTTKLRRIHRAFGDFEVHNGLSVRNK